jgi:hypothetical protein
MPMFDEIEAWNRRAEELSECKEACEREAVILCGGPSLGGFDSAFAESKTVITVNRVTHSLARFHIAPSADVLADSLPHLPGDCIVATTAAVFSKESEPVLAELLQRGSFLAERVEANLFLKFKKREPITFSDYERIDLARTAYLPGGSAGAMATAVALRFGARVVYQFGMDGWTPFVGVGESPYADGSSWSFQKRGEKMMRYQEDLVNLALKRCAQFARQRGARIVNMNPNSLYQAALAES